MKITNSPQKILDWLLYVTLLIYYLSLDAIAFVVGKNGSRLGGIILILELVIILVIYLIKYRGKIYFRLTLFHFSLIGFIGYCFLTALWAVDAGVVITRSVNLAENAIIMMLFFLVLDTHEDLVEALLNIVMMGGFLLVALYILRYGWSYVIDSLKNSGRATSEVINANTLGMAAAYSGIIFVYRLMKKEMKLWWIPLMALSMVALIVSQSRKGILILVVGVAAVFLLNNIAERNRVRVLKRIGLVLLLIVLLIYPLIASGVLEGVAGRLEGLIQAVVGAGDGDKSTQMRQHFVQIGLELFRAHPIQGIGIECSQFFTEPFYNYPYHLHNNYIELLSDGGILGLVIYYWIYAYMLIQMVRCRDFTDPTFNVCFVILIIRLVMDYGYFAYKEKGTYVFLLLLFMECMKLVKKKNLPRIQWFLRA